MFSPSLLCLRITAAGAAVSTPISLLLTGSGRLEPQLPKAKHLHIWLLPPPPLLGHGSFRRSRQVLQTPYPHPLSLPHHRPRCSDQLALTRRRYCSSWTLFQVQLLRVSLQTWRQWTAWEQHASVKKRKPDRMCLFTVSHWNNSEYTQWVNLRCI